MAEDLAHPGDAEPACGRVPVGLFSIHEPAGRDASSARAEAERQAELDGVLALMRSHDGGLVAEGNDMLPVPGVVRVIRLDRTADWLPLGLDITFRTKAEAPSSPFAMAEHFPLKQTVASHTAAYVRAVAPNSLAALSCGSLERAPLSNTRERMQATSTTSTAGDANGGTAGTAGTAAGTDRDTVATATATATHGGASVCAGVSENDEILSIGGESVVALTPAQILQRLDTQVVLLRCQQLEAADVLPTSTQKRGHGRRVAAGKEDCAIS